VETGKLVSKHGGAFRGFEDPCVWLEDGRYRMLVKDMGYFLDPAGCYLESDDGLNWSTPERGYYSTSHYWGEERKLDSPLFLMDHHGRPEYLFANRFSGGLARGYVFKVRSHR
jgi:hypothetical protein